MSLLFKVGFVLAIVATSAVVTVALYRASSNSSSTTMPPLWLTNPTFTNTTYSDGITCRIPNVYYGNDSRILSLVPEIVQWPGFLSLTAGQPYVFTGDSYTLGGKGFQDNRTFVTPPTIELQFTPLGDGTSCSSPFANRNNVWKSMLVSVPLHDALPDPMGASCGGSMNYPEVPNCASNSVWSP
jgi:hypothetical protein